MIRDYKQYYEENKLKNFYIKYDGKHFNDALLEDLIKDQPGSIALSSFIRVRDNLDKLDKKIIQSFCLECQVYEYWARVIMAILEEIEGYEKLSYQLSDEKDLFSSSDESKNKDQNEAKYSKWFREQHTLKEYEWMYVNQKLGSLPIDTAKIIDEVFYYYNYKVIPELSQRDSTDNPIEYDDHSNINNQHNAIPLIDIVKKLPPYNSSMSEDLVSYYEETIDDWIFSEGDAWDYDLNNTAPGKRGHYLFDRINELLDSFHDYIPITRDDWENKRSGSDYFYCLAMETYYDLIYNLRLTYKIKDAYTHKIDTTCWFLEDIDEVNKTYKEAINSIPIDKYKKLKDFIDAITDYVENYHGDHSLDKQQLYKDKIKEWVDQKNKEIGEDFVYKKITPDMRSLYLLNVVRDTMDEFDRYLPASHQDFLDLIKGPQWYYYYALEFLFIRILDDLSVYNIKSDEYEYKLKNMVAVFFWDEDMIQRFEQAKHKKDSSSHHNSNNENPIYKISLPKKINKGNAQKYYQRAIENNYLELTDGGAIWKTSQIQLGYFCYKIYKKPRPIAAIQSFFNKRNVGASITQADVTANSENPRNDVQEWLDKMNKTIFFD